MRWGASRRAGASIMAAAALVGCLQPPDEADPVPAPVDVEFSPPPAEQLRSETVERLARQVTLRVRNRGCGGVATGSAVAVGEDLLVTNRHVIEGAELLEVNTWDGRSLTVEVAQAALTHDIAVARVPEGLPEVAIVADDDPEPGDPVIVAGYPGGGALVVREGEVLRRTVDVMFGAEAGAIAFDAEVAPGSSGGPVLDPEGRVVGVVYALSPDDGVGFAVPVSALREALDAGDALVGVPPCP
jgi:S1-C subfamily serine protease